MKQIPEKYKNNVEDITEFLKAIHEEKNNSDLIKNLIKKIDNLINEIEQENVIKKLEMLKNKIILLRKNVEVCSDDFLEESFYLLSYMKKLDK